MKWNTPRLSFHKQELFIDILINVLLSVGSTYTIYSLLLKSIALSPLDDYKLDCNREVENQVG